ncbi:hypothetical protein CDL15_Pgr009817 [Punica granatum]|nr:hypothetical protein CDL15_Pgr009817 [Punica granatum]
MKSGLCLATFSCKNNDDGDGLDLKISSMESYSLQFVPKLESFDEPCQWTSVPLSGEARNSKRAKLGNIAEESVGSNSGSIYSICSSMSSNSLNGLPGLHFRDHVRAYTQRFLAVEAMEEAAAAMIWGSQVDEAEEDGSGVDEMRLVQQLVAGAEAVACRDKVHASALLSELQARALVFGTSFQRVASCFVQGLSDRLALVQHLGAVGILGQGGNPAPRRGTMTSERKEALRLVYEICPYIQFGHFVANASVMEAFEGESSVHVIDLGMTLGLPCGHQWWNLMHSLAHRPGGPPHKLRITGIGYSIDCLCAIGNDLERYSKSLGMNFEFLAIENSLENLRVEDFNVEEGEALVINSILQLHCVVKESRGALNSVLQMLHKLSPRLLVLVEQDSSHNGPFFLGRFMEALHYYSAIFDSLDVMLPKYDTRRAKMEQFFFAEEIKNIVSCEGPARVERHEKIDQWRRRMSRAGFQPAPIKMLAQVKQWLGESKAWDGFTVVEEKGCLVLGWNLKPMVAASCWKCN